MRMSGRFWIYGAALIVITCSVALWSDSVLRGTAFRDAPYVLKWPTADGRVTSIVIEEDPRMKARRFNARMEYAYQVKDERFFGEAPLSHIGKTPEEVMANLRAFIEDADSLKWSERSTPSGRVLYASPRKTVTVRYNPDDPALSVIKWEGPGAGESFTAVFLAFLAVPAVIGLSVLVYWRLKAPRPLAKRFAKGPFLYGKNRLSWKEDAEELLDEGRHKDALLCFERSLDLSPKEEEGSLAYCESLLGKGRCLYELKRLEEARAALKEAAEKLKKIKDEELLSEALSCLELAEQGLKSPKEA
ncbi:MAG: DUF3592 domain-containing protein [Deltaproteobacteria bacterium]|nr:DUF3592 domain-containing protein [Deltaproteobacteria bacterium]